MEIRLVLAVKHDHEKVDFSDHWNQYSTQPGLLMGSGRTCTLIALHLSCSTACPQAHIPSKSHLASAECSGNKKGGRPTFRCLTAAAQKPRKTSKTHRNRFSPYVCRAATCKSCEMTAGRSEWDVVWLVRLPSASKSISEALQLEALHLSNSVYSHQKAWHFWWI